MSDLRLPLLTVALAMIGLDASGCAFLPSDEEPSQRTLEDDGRACLSNVEKSENDDRYRLTAGTTEIGVNFNSCLGCGDEVRESECSYEVDGDRIVVESRIVIYSEPVRGACTTACRDAPQTTNCNGPELEAGDYTLVHGDATTNFTVPSTERICARASP